MTTSSSGSQLRGTRPTAQDSDARAARVSRQAVEAALPGLRELQRVALGIYGRLEPDRALIWTVEELGELAQAVRRDEGRTRLEELGQLTVWMLCLANNLDLDLAGAVESAIREEIERQLAKYGTLKPYRQVGEPVIKIGLPRGRMVAESERFCGALGVQVRPGVLRYLTTVGGLDVSVLLVKAPDVARLLRRHRLDLGLAGDEWLMETGVPPDCRCFEVRSYVASVCLLMAADDARPPRSIHTVATPYPSLARRLLGRIAPDAEIMPVSGSSEALVPDIADACLDLVETGTSAALNSLTVHRVFHHVTTHLARSVACDPATVAPIVGLLAGTLEAAR